MRIAFLCAPTPNMIRPSYLGRHLLRRGHEVHVIIPPSPREPELYGLDRFPIPVHRCPPGSLREVVSRLRELAPDVVHCMDAGRATLPPTLRYCARSAALSVVDMPDRLVQWRRLRSKLAFIYEYQALARADAVIVASQDLLTLYQRRRPRARLEYLPFGLDLEFFEQHRHRAAEIRARYGSLKLLTYLGALVPQYSPIEALRMAKVLCQRRQDFRLLYLGRGPQQAQLERQTRAWGLERLVEFVGFVPEDMLPAWLAASDVLLLPLADNAANRYRCPQKAFWYLGARRPIVANPVGEVYRALEDEALYYRFGDPADFADQVERALSASAPLPSAARLAAHSWEARADRYERLLSSLRAG